MQKPSLALIVMAAGSSTRFGSNKLLACYKGEPVCARVFAATDTGLFCRAVTVTQYAGVAALAEAAGHTVVINDRPELGASLTVRLGLQAIDADGVDGALFAVADQPLLTRQSVEALISCWQASPGRMAALAANGKKGNPVIFPRALFSELMALEGDRGGSAVIKEHKELLTLCDAAQPQELYDIDTAEEFIKIGGII